MPTNKLSITNHEVDKARLAWESATAKSAKIDFIRHDAAMLDMVGLDAEFQCKDNRWDTHFS